MDIFLILGLTCLCGLIFLQTKHMQKALERQRQQDLVRLQELENELNALSNASIGVGRKAIEQDTVITALESKIEEIQLNEPTKASYSEASRLAGMGASVEELMQACAISMPEAELIRTLSLSGVKQTDSKLDEIPLLKEQI